MPFFAIDKKVGRKTMVKGKKSGSSFGLSILFLYLCPTDLYAVCLFHLYILRGGP